MSQQGTTTDFSSGAPPSGGDQPKAEQAKEVAGQAAGQAKDVAGQATGQAKEVASQATDQAKDVAATAVDQAKQVSAEARQQLTSVTQQATGQAKQVVSTATGEARTQIEDRLGQATGMARERAGQLRALTEGRPEEAGPVADWAQQATDRLEAMADRVDELGVDGVVQEVTRFARNRPVAFLVGAAAAGLVVGRIARAGKEASSDDSSNGSSNGAALSGSATPSIGTGSPNPGTYATGSSVQPGIPAGSTGAVAPAVVPSDIGGGADLADGFGGSPGAGGF